MKVVDYKYLESKVDWVWNETLKVHKIASETRIASSISPIEIFVSLYYGGLIKYDSRNPLSDDRDRFIISKGHGSISMYPILADLGFFSKSELTKVCTFGSLLGGIPDPSIPGYETINGSLGHGLGVASGVALALKKRNKKNNVFVLSGDGELHEGSNWESIMFSSHNSLDNLNLLVDNNKTCMLGHTENVVSHGDLQARFESFGWNVFKVNGHNIKEVHSSILKMI